MEIERNPIKKLWTKLAAFLDREMSFTLLFWLITFLITVIIKIIFMVNILGRGGK